MQPINYRRLALGGTIASAVLFLGSGALIGSQSARITAAREAARVPPYVPAPFLGAIEVLLFGFALIWLYAAIRPRFGAGPTAAARAGLPSPVRAVPAAGTAPILKRTWRGWPEAWSRTS